MISGIHHLGLTVRDVDASAAWYQKVLGCRRDKELESADGATQSPVAAANSIPGAVVLVFRDPGQIQLSSSPTLGSPRGASARRAD